MGVETEAKFAALLDVYTGAAFVIDGDGRYREILGGSSGDELLVEEPSTLQGRRFHEILPTTLANRFLDTIQRTLETDTPEVIEYEMDVQSGTRWFEASVAPIPNGGERPESVIWAARDVTERKRFEESLTALHDAGTAIASQESAAAICEETIGAAENVLEFDQSVIALESDGVLETEAMSERLSEDDVASIPIEEGLAGKTYRTGESQLVEDANDVEAARTSTSYRSGISVPIGDHGNFQAVAEEPGAFDETDLELAEILLSQTEASLTRLEHEQVLRRRNERLDEFASIVSHDLQSPLNVASGRLELAREECDSEHLDEIASAHDRMEGLIEDLLTLAQTGRTGSDFEPVDLPTLLEECWQLVETGDATLRVRTSRTIRGDRTRLRQVFENLLGNAIDHGGDAVTVTVGDVDGGIYVEDDGPGVPEVKQDRLFEVGFSTTESGTGFGLHIVDTVVQHHGWEIAVETGSDGGARFEIAGIDEV